MALILSVIVAASVGAVSVPLRSVAGILLHRAGAWPHPLSWSATDATIVLDVRLPRVVTAALIGAALSAAGVLFQALLRNPLADPYSIGTSGGAALGATVGVILSARLGVGWAGVPTLAFVGAIGTTLFVYSLARVGGKTPIVTLLLAGLSVSVILGYSMSLLLLMTDRFQRDLRILYVWLLGGVTTAPWSQVGMTAVIVIVGCACALGRTRRLNALALGDEASASLGLHVERERGDRDCDWRVADRRGRLRGRLDRIRGLDRSARGTRPGRTESRSVAAAGDSRRRDLSRARGSRREGRAGARGNPAGHRDGLHRRTVVSVSAAAHQARLPVLRWRSSSSTTRRFAYGARRVLDRISLRLDPGERVAVIGANGAGKTTLLKVLGGVLRANGGSVQIDGTDVAEIPRRQMARLVAMVPQELVIPFSFTVREMVELGRTAYLRLFGGFDAADRHAVEHALEVTDSTALASRVVNELSGGERQRVLVAMALAQQPRILLLDEPTQRLDLTRQAEILDLIRDVSAERGLTRPGGHSRSESGGAVFRSADRCCRAARSSPMARQARS